ncbi:MAG: 50S ribosomal protein L13 [candidate division WS1 bacterium]|nr:50S ribosomal protein L13 [candidate division WS1 bacterium]
MSTRSVQVDPSQREWFQISAAGLPLGRLASRVALVLRGKHKPSYTPHADNGDFVIITEAARVLLTGNKWRDKKYYRHSGHPGGLREETAQRLRQRAPEAILRHAVAGMLPKNALGRQMLRKLKVYPGAEHPHEAQQAKPLEL